MNLSPAPFSTALSIIDEQDEFLIVDKPAGLAVHQTSIEAEQTLAQLLRENLGKTDLYPCHRLDQATSGLLLVAKSAEANRALSRLFSQRAIEKYYVALSDKKPLKKQGLIKGDMKTSRNGCWKLTRNQQNPAITQFFSYGLENGLRLFLLKPHTGKTHQLRVALKSLGSPILGDARYAGASADRCYLHAAGLAFSFAGKQYRYQSAPTFGTFFNAQTFTQKLAEIGDISCLKWPKIKGL